MSCSFYISFSSPAIFSAVTIVVLRAYGARASSPPPPPDVLKGGTRLPVKLLETPDAFIESFLENNNGRICVVAVYEYQNTPAAAETILFMPTPPNMFRNVARKN